MTFPPNGGIWVKDVTDCRLNWLWRGWRRKGIIRSFVNLAEEGYRDMGRVGDFLTGFG